MVRKIISFLKEHSKQTITGIFIIIYLISTLVIVYEISKDDISPEESGAASESNIPDSSSSSSNADIYNINLAMTQILSDDIFVLQGDQLHSAPKKGRYNFKELYDEVGAFAQLPGLAEKDSVTVQTVHITESGRRTILIHLRFHKDEATGEWWLNSIWMRVKISIAGMPMINIYLTSLKELALPSANISEDFVNQLYDVHIGPKKKFGESLTVADFGEVENQLVRIPLYAFNQKTYKVQSKEWGKFVLKNPRIISFKDEG